MAKSTKPTIRVHDLETDEIIDREMNDAEFAEYQANQIATQSAKNEAETKLATKAAIADRLGLTADELAVLLG